MPHKNPHRPRRTLKWLSICVLCLLAVATGVIYFVSDVGGLVGSKASAKLGREFSIDGPIHIDWDWTTPYVLVSKVRIANAEGSKDPNMVDIDEVDFHIRMWKLLLGQLNLPDIKLVNPHILLEKKADKTKNWDFPALSKANAVTSSVLPASRSSVPLIGTMAIENGVLAYRDATQNLDLRLDIDSVKGLGLSADNTGNFKISGTGTLQGQSFRISANGGSLSMLRSSSVAYPLELHIDMGKTSFAVNGTFTDPIKMSDLDANLDLSGDTLADLFYLTAIPLPPTPPYKLSGHLSKRGEEWAFKNFKGIVGKSDLSGNLTYDTSGERNLTKAELTSNNLSMKDLGGLIGIHDKPQSPPPEKSDRLMPDVPINLGRLRASDMAIDLKAAHIDQPGWPLDNLEAAFNLKDGLLRLDPLSFGIADGKITGSILLDGRQDEPKMSLDLSLQKLSLKPFFGNTRFEQFSSGAFGGRVQIDGHGHTFADVMGDGNGRVTLLMAGGTVSKLIIDAAGLDFGKATPDLIGKDQSTPIRCVIGDFGVKDGLLNSNIFVVDTGASNIQGNAAINLKDESLDIKFEAHPKKASLTARTPITITGPFRSPSVGLDVKEIAGRGAAAAALSLLMPLAAIIPFIEPGLGKDSDCQRYIDEARAHSGSAPPPAP